MAANTTSGLIISMNGLRSGVSCGMSSLLGPWGHSHIGNSRREISASPVGAAPSPLSDDF